MNNKDIKELTKNLQEESKAREEMLDDALKDIAVYSENSNVDPVGACIGERGSRINSIIKELNGEKIDIIAYNNSGEEFIANALSPAKNVRVFIVDEKNKEALVVVDEDNLSLAIGKKGLNVRLASRLTHYKLDVKTLDQVKESGINILE